ncbi:MAG: peptidoglycan-binding protein [Acidimicrobiia bacterium]
MMDSTFDVDRGNRDDVDGEPSMSDTTRNEPPIGDSPRRSRLGWWIAGVLVLAAGVAVVAAVLASGGDTEAVADTTLSVATVTQTDLVVTQDLDGTLGFGTAETLTFRSSNDGIVTYIGGGVGTVTWVVPEGSTVESGDVLYVLDSSPVMVFAGDLPAYRSFNSRMSNGPDVAQLEQALVDLGYDTDAEIVVDEDFTSATRDAIKRLQESIGAEETGSLDLGYVLFVSDPLYVATMHVSVGDFARVGEPVVSTSRAISGTVTTLVDEGSIVGQGDELLTVDAEPVVLLFGDIPVYRGIARGASGTDVAQLQRGLIDLGFGDDFKLVATGEFDDATFAALTAWQESIGATPDGVVNVGDIFFLPEAIRIGQNLVAVGDRVNDGTPILSSSVSSTVVSVQLSTDDQDLAAVGDAVIVELPAGTREPAMISTIGTVVLTNQQGETYFEMTVTLDDADAAQGLDEAPVDVEVISDRADGVLAVPVTALLALAEGGYAVEVVPASGETYLVGVDPGLFADGFVEVTGSGLDAGMEVVVP